MSELSEPEERGVGDFFAVDRRSWARACELGMNPAVAYLVHARGTGPDNRTTLWSVQAIEKYTEISRGRAGNAIKALCRAGVVRQTRNGMRPRYYLVPWDQLPGNGTQPRAPLTKRQQAVYDMVLVGKQLSGPDKQCACQLTQKGWLSRGDDRAFQVVSNEPKDEPDWVWLPNELVTGAVDETPPTELVRQTQDVMTVRLLVDLYHAQNLAEDGGISRKFTWQEYERVKVGQQAQYDVWGFRSKSVWVAWDGPTQCHKREDLTDEEIAEGKTAGVDFFRRQGQLVDLGLIECVPHLLESDAPDAEIIHPCGMNRSDSLDDRLGTAAHHAGSAMLTEGQLHWAEDRDLWLVPVPRHIGNVQMIGIARLRYRPRTKLTAAWWVELNTKGDRYIRRYSDLADGVARRAAVS